jgi:serine phosphatase RsbU (regulator of sigma subunit)
VNLLYLLWVPWLAPHPWLSLGVGCSSVIIGAICLALARKTGRHFFFRLVMTINGGVAFTFCALSGPAPSYLVGIAYVSAVTVLSRRLPETLLFMAIGLTEIIMGSWLSGKTGYELLTIAVILTGYALVLVRFMQYTLRQGDEIMQAKHEIEEKNRSITDSINYALRIQNAKLPEKQKIHAALPQSFVLFSPKDIVSGDFYFFHRKNHLVYLAAADCTGHGVPGAMMSMIGMERLDDVLQQLDHPSEILHHLNRNMKTSLRQTGSGESTRDGMDIALCRIDAANGTITYAGANRPVWIIRKGATVVEEIRATKKAIGGLTPDDTVFGMHELVLQPGDGFYVFSDGYADQFGGRTDKKLTTKKFKELLLSIQHLDMHQQGEHLETFMESWRENAEQVDDILVMGVRV